MRKSITAAVLAALLTAGLLVVHQPAVAKSDPRSWDVARAVAATEKANADGRATVTAVRANRVPSAVDGPSDYYSEGHGTRVGSGDVFTQAVWALPFNYQFDISWGLYSREFVSGTGKVCTWLRATKISGGVPTGGNYIDVELYVLRGSQVGPTVQWPIDDEWYTWCWITSNATVYRWWFGMEGRSNGVWVHGEGVAENG